MTLKEIESNPKEMLVPHDIAEVLGSDPQSIRCQARIDASALGFPVIIIKNRVKIPKAAFIKFCKGEHHENP